MTISIESAVLISLLAFVSGFFVNLIAMRKMFVSKSEFQDYRESRTKVWNDHDRMRQEFRKYIESMCETKRAGCAPLRGSIENIEKDINELFKLIRENYGRLERVVGRLDAGKLTGKPE